MKLEHGDSRKAGKLNATYWQYTAHVLVTDTTWYADRIRFVNLYLMLQHSKRISTIDITCVTHEEMP